MRTETEHERVRRERNYAYRPLEPYMADVMDRVRQQASDLAQAFNEHSPKHAERELAIAQGKLEEALMWFQAGLDRHG